MRRLRLQPRFPVDSVRRELLAYSMFRAFEAAMIAFVVSGPGTGWLGEQRFAEIAPWVCVAYLAVSLVLLLLARSRVSITVQIAAGTLLDILFANLAIQVLPDATPVVAIMLVLNVAAASLLLSLPFGLASALLAGATFIAQDLWRHMAGAGDTRPFAEPFAFTGAYFAIAFAIHSLGKRVADSETVATQRGAEAADLASINELIIRRMPTGVLIVEGDGRIALANTSAMSLLGVAGDGHRVIDLTAPALAQRLQQWRDSTTTPLQRDLTPIRMGPDNADIVPQFIRLHADGDQVLCFLDDTSQASRRAESITLAALGRFSASLAHEIRNPLSAISYSTQLLEESRDLTAMDRKMLEIVRQQTQRMNGIVESVLSLARRERARPEPVDLVELAMDFLEEYTHSYPLDVDSLDLALPKDPLMAMADPKHVHQIILVLVSNARYYGRMPEQPARITVRVHRDGARAAVDVLDRGPGISEHDQRQLFRPFHTTSPHGTGLGLHIARELAHANGGDLVYIRMPIGSCFRLTLPGKG